MLLSVPFMIITFCVYAFIRELRNLHGKCLMCYVASLTFLYVSMSVIKLKETALIQEDQKTACVILGYTSLTSMLMCFLWLNAMCFDIWTTFRHGMTFDNLKRFLSYCAFAFGIPLILALISFLLNHFELIPEKFNNQIGKGTCRVGSNDPHNEWIIHFTYVYLPIIITISINIVFYSITAYKIYRVQKETAFKDGESKRHAKRSIERTR